MIEAETGQVKGKGLMTVDLAEPETVVEDTPGGEEGAEARRKRVPIDGVPGHLGKFRVNADVHTPKGFGRIEEINEEGAHVRLFEQGMRHSDRRVELFPLAALATPTEANPQLNSSGVYQVGIEKLQPDFSTETKTTARIYLVEDKEDGLWRTSFDLDSNWHGTGSFPSYRSTPHAGRAGALRSSVDQVRTHLEAIIKREEKAVAKRIKRAIAELNAWAERQGDGAGAGETAKSRPAKRARRKPRAKGAAETQPTPQTDSAYADETEPEKLLEMAFKEQCGRYEAIRTMELTLASGESPATGRALGKSKTEALERELEEQRQFYEGTYNEVSSAFDEATAMGLRERVERDPETFAAITLVSSMLKTSQQIKESERSTRLARRHRKEAEARHERIIFWYQAKEGGGAVHVVLLEDGYRHEVRVLDESDRRTFTKECATLGEADGIAGQHAAPFVLPGARMAREAGSSNSSNKRSKRCAASKNRKSGESEKSLTKGMLSPEKLEAPPEKTGASASTALDAATELKFQPQSRFLQSFRMVGECASPNHTHSPGGSLTVRYDWLGQFEGTQIIVRITARPLPATGCYLDAQLVAGSDGFSSEQLISLARMIARSDEHSRPCRVRRADERYRRGRTKGAAQGLVTGTTNIHRFDLLRSRAEGGEEKIISAIERARKAHGARTREALREQLDALVIRRYYAGRTLRAEALTAEIARLDRSIDLYLRVLSLLKVRKGNRAANAGRQRENVRGRRPRVAQKLSQEVAQLKLFA